MSLSYVPFGPPASVLVVVRDQDGAPVPGITVTIENSSGTQGGFTDDSGQAIIRPAESEVLRIWIGAEEFRLRHAFWFDDLFAPECFGDGLTFFAFKTRSSQEAVLKVRNQSGNQKGNHNGSAADMDELAH